MSPFTIFDLVHMVPRLAGGANPYLSTVSRVGTHVSCQTPLSRSVDGETAAIIVTHYHSTNREIEAIADFCRGRNISLIEDCAISLGARIDGRHVGSFGDFALFSRPVQICQHLLLVALSCATP